MTGIGAAIHKDNPLFHFLADLGDVYRAGDFDHISGKNDGWMFKSVFGDHELKIVTDPEESDDEYLLVGFLLPDNCYVETDSDMGTETLYGFRIYREKA